VVVELGDRVQHCSFCDNPGPESTLYTPGPRYTKISVTEEKVGNAIDSGMVLSITIDKLRVFINKTLSILSAYQ
jgi:hypothetical protein